jgi:hypothetical protein
MSPAPREGWIVKCKGKYGVLNVSIANKVFIKKCGTDMHLFHDKAEEVMMKPSVQPPVSSQFCSSMP